MSDSSSESLTLSQPPQKMQHAHNPNLLRQHSLDPLVLKTESGDISYFVKIELHKSVIDTIKKLVLSHRGCEMCANNAVEYSTLRNADGILFFSEKFYSELVGCDEKERILFDKIKNFIKTIPFKDIGIHIVQDENIFEKIAHKNTDKHGIEYCHWSILSTSRTSSTVNIEFIKRALGNYPFCFFNDVFFGISTTVNALIKLRTLYEILKTEQGGAPFFECVKWAINTREKIENSPCHRSIISIYLESMISSCIIQTRFNTVQSLHLDTFANLKSIIFKRPKEYDSMINSVKLFLYPLSTLESRQVTKEQAETVWENVKESCDDLFEKERTKSTSGIKYLGYDGIQHHYFGFRGFIPNMCI